MKYVIGLLCLNFIVFFHELGHFIFAKFFGVKVLSFSIGMGPVILHKTIKGVDYRISLLPIGGYCAMEGEKDFQKALEYYKKADDPVLTPSITPSIENDSLTYPPPDILQDDNPKLNENYNTLYQFSMDYWLFDFNEEEHIKKYIDGGMDKKDAIKRVAKERGVPKSSLYKYTIDK